MAAILLPALLASAGTALAYAPTVAAALASRIPDALPPAARWDPAWSAAVGAEVERLLEADELDPEEAASRRRFDPGGPAHDPAAGDEAAGSARVAGWSPFALAAAAEALIPAFSGRQASLIVRRMAELAIGAADLADPYLVTPGEGDAPHSPARFSDLVAASDLADLVPGGWDCACSGVEAGIELGRRSAAARTAIDGALRRGDVAAWKALRRERLGSALALAHDLTLAAWSAAHSPSLEHAAPGPSQARVRPNPARDRVTVSFALPRAEDAKIELFDLAGRRIWTRAIGPRRAGPQEVEVDGSVVRALPPGLYLVRVSGEPGHAALGRLIRLAD